MDFQELQCAGGITKFRQQNHYGLLLQLIVRNYVPVLPELLLWNSYFSTSVVICLNGVTFHDNGSPLWCIQMYIALFQFLTGYAVEIVFLEWSLFYSTS